MPAVILIYYEICWRRSPDQICLRRMPTIVARLVDTTGDVFLDNMVNYKHTLCRSPLDRSRQGKEIRHWPRLMPQLREHNHVRYGDLSGTGHKLKLARKDRLCSPIQR